MFNERVSHARERNTLIYDTCLLLKEHVLRTPIARTQEGCFDL